MTPLQAALRILASHGRRTLLDEHYAAAPETARVPAAGRPLTKELVWGVVRRRGSLDFQLDRLLDRPGRLPREVREVLRLGAYQLLYLDHTPDWAAVDETVELVRFAGRPRMAGLVNAVLRRLQREGAVAPDERSDPLGHLVAWGSHPRWLVRRWLERDGFEVTRARLEANNRRPLLTLRVNLRRTDAGALREKLAAAGIESRPGALPGSLVLDRGAAPERLPGYGEGLFFVQDLSAQATAPFTVAEPGMRLLEIAAAPGGKTTHLLERAPGLRIVALDSRPDRLARLAANLRRLGLEGAVLLAARGDALPLLPAARFERVLLDAPCSNTGVLARRIDARWRLRPRDIEQLAALQGALLACAAPHVAPGGCLIYSTCSIEPEENEWQVERFLADRREFVLQEQRLLLPEREWPGSGGFMVRLARVY